ncbi:hypothetical protein, partial [Leucothrix pacifica]
AAGFLGGIASGASLKGALKGALFVGLTAGVANWVGHGAGGLSPFGGASWLAHGITQGAIAELRGGKFKHGFISAVAGHVSGIVTRGIGGIRAGAIAARTAVASVFGGLATKATGGSFHDGAVTAAIVHLFNAELSGRHVPYKKEGNKITIKQGIKFVGFSKDQIDKFIKNVNGKWSGTFGKYTVDTEISSVKDSFFVVHLVDSSKLVDGSRAYVLAGQGQMYIDSKSLSGSVPAHEFGHFLGIDDHYTVKTFPELGMRLAVPDSEYWRGTMMGERFDNVTYKDVQALWENYDE